MTNPITLATSTAFKLTSWWNDLRLKYGLQRGEAISCSAHELFHMRGVSCKEHSFYPESFWFHLILQIPHLMVINHRCGESAESLYVEFSEGNIRLTRCVSLIKHSKNLHLWDLPVLWWIARANWLLMGIWKWTLCATIMIVNLSYYQWMFRWHIFLNDRETGALRKCQRQIYWVWTNIGGDWYYSSSETRLPTFTP